MSDLNPYAAPADLSYPPALPTSGNYFREGEFLRIQDQAELPMLCILTGEPLEPQDWRKRVPIVWSPPWIWVGLVLGLVPVLILMVITQKRAKITYGVSQMARKRILRKRWIALGLLFGGIAMIVVAANLDSPAAFAIGIAGGVMILAALIISTLVNPVKPAGYHKGWFKLKGFCPQFLSTLPPFPYASPQEIPEPVKRR